MHEFPLITTIAAAFTAAWLLGLLTQRLGLSPIVGYLVAGVLIGPHTPGFVGDLDIAHQLAEVGVILLMFGVGLHFHLKDLLAVKGVAIPGAIGQSLVATGLGIAVFTGLGLPLATGAVIGMAISVASTVVLMRVLMDADALNTPQGHIAVGWLLVEDLFTVVVLVLIPALGVAPAIDAEHVAHSAGGLWSSIGLALLKLSAGVGLLILIGRRAIPWVLVQVARLRSRELFTLTVLVFSIAIAAAAYSFFGTSTALGAFVAGMVVAQSPLSHQAAADALPMRDAFAVLFFVAVGMLFDPAIVVQEPLMIAAALGIILIAKPLAALGIVVLLGHSSRTALTVALALAQIGEFSFILSEVARGHGLMSESGHSVLVAAAIISITLNPLLFHALDPIERWLARRPGWWSFLNARAERRAREANRGALAPSSAAKAVEQRLAVLVGYGPVGRAIHGLLREADLATMIIEMNMDTVTELKAQGQPVIFGDASREVILEQAGVKRASYLIVALPHAAPRIAVVVAARGLNPDLRILVRAHYLSERPLLEQIGVTAAVFEEGEAAVGLARLVLADSGTSRDAIAGPIRDLRIKLLLENTSTLADRPVRSVMVPWTRVRRLSLAATREQVLKQIAQWRYARWPVVDPKTGRAVGYLHAKDLSSDRAEDDWTKLVRPIRVVEADDDIASLLTLPVQEEATIRVVHDHGSLVGFISIDDILDQVVGKVSDTHEPSAMTSLKEVVAAGGAIAELAARTADQAIAELAAMIPADRLPPHADVVDRAMAREREVPTDLGIGVAVPHARVPHLRSPIAVVGRSHAGIPFSDPPAQPVHLIVLLVTPAERPDLQVILLGQVARLAGDRQKCERLLQAGLSSDIMDIVGETSATRRIDNRPDAADDSRQDKR